MTIMEQALMMDAESAVDLRSARPAEVAPSPPVEASNLVPATGQSTGAVLPRCGHSACRQNWIDTGDDECIHPDACLDCGGKGWDIYNAGADNEGIQRCDTCRRFGTDEDAEVAAAADTQRAFTTYAKGIVDLCRRLIRGELIVATCGKCAKAYTLAEFLLLPSAGMPGDRRPKFWQGVNGDTYELRNCNSPCDSTLSRLVPR